MDVKFGIRSTDISNAQVDKSHIALETDDV